MSMYMKPIELCIEAWWKVDYPNYSLSEANVEITVFNKHDEGQMKKFFTWDIHFSTTDTKKISNWKDSSSKNTILIEQDLQTKDFHYEKHEESNGTTKTTKVKKNSDGESGHAEINNKGSIETIFWQISHDETEYIVTLKKKVNCPKRGLIKVEEKMKFDNNSKEFHIKEVGNSIKIDKCRVETSEQVVLKIEKSGPDLEKSSKCVLRNGTEKGEIIRKRREELRKITWDKTSTVTEIQDTIQILGPVDELRKEIGKFKHVTSNNNYRLDWILTDKYFNGKANLFNNQNHCFHFYKKTEYEVSDISEFISENNKWGMIENDSKNDKYNLQWIKKKPIVYEELTNNIVNKGLDADRVGGRVNGTEAIEEFKQHANFLFSFIGQVNINQFPKFRMFNENNKSEECFGQQVNILLKSVKDNVEIADQILKCQSVKECQRQMNRSKETEIEAFRNVVRYGNLNSQDLFLRLANF